MQPTYRVFMTPGPTVMDIDAGVGPENYYSFIEVFCDEAGNIERWDTCYPIGDSIEDLQDLAWMLEATNLPVLKEEDLP